MKKIKTSFTQNEIDLLNQHYNLSDIAREMGLNPKNNEIYRIMRKFPKRVGSRAYLVQKKLEQLLEDVQAKSVSND